MCRFYCSIHSVDSSLSVNNFLSLRMPTSFGMDLVFDHHSGKTRTGISINSAANIHRIAVTGITVTKLDGTAKGGVMLAIADRLGVPVRYIGIGESAEDMQDFNARDFVDALLANT